MARKLASGASVEIHDVLDSTSLEAKRRAAAGERGPFWIVALKQTAGYGRRGNEWLQAEGDIAATFLFSEETAAENAPQLSFVAALSVGDAALRFAPRAPIAFKWPNDILMDGGKLAGLLLELLSAGEQPVIALGVGVNVVSAPQGMPYRTARLVDVTSNPPSPSEFVAALDETFAAWSALWRREGFRPIRDAWSARAYGFGRRGRAETASGPVNGVIRGIDDDGALILETANGAAAIAAGSLFIEQS